MAPRFKRKRESSRASSSTGTQHSGRSKASRSRRSSQPSQRRLPPKWQAHHREVYSDAQNSTPPHFSSQSAPRHAAETEEVDEDLDQVVMGIDRSQKGTIGCAYYVAREEKLFCLQDVVNGTLDAVETR